MTVAGGRGRLLLPDDWSDVLSGVLSTERCTELAAFVEKERHNGSVFPPAESMFRAFELTPYADVKVVILGQDPYHAEGQAHGLAFSVQQGRVPPSLRKVFKELERDPDVSPPESGNLEGWARQGVLLLNTVLTVRAGEPNSHRQHGWEDFTDAVVQAVDRKPERVVFLLWGTAAQQKVRSIDTDVHAAIRNAHPAARTNARSPLVGSGAFSTTNRLLLAAGRTPVEWHRSAGPVS